MDRADAALRLRDKFLEAGFARAPAPRPASEGPLTLPGDVERSPALLRELAVESHDLSSAEGVAMQQVQIRAEPAPKSAALPVIAVKFDDDPPKLLPPEPSFMDAPPELSLVPALLADLSRSFFCYFLIVVLCALSLFKVYQVQQTRELTAQLNEVQAANENLDRQWLVLTSQRQTLSEHARIRRAAQENLHMRAPKTDAELMIAVKTP